MGALDSLEKESVGSVVAAAVLAVCLAEALHCQLDPRAWPQLVQGMYHVAWLGQSTVESFHPGERMCAVHSLKRPDAVLPRAPAA